MKLCSVLVFLSLINLSRCYFRDKSVAIALSEYIKNHFVEKSIKFDFITDFDDDVPFDELLKEVKELDSYTIIKIDGARIDVFKLERSAIFVFKSYANYQRLEDKLNFDLDEPLQVEVLIYSPGLSLNAIEKKLPTDLYQIRSFLIDEAEYIDLKALVLFTPSKCSSQQLVTINKFSKDSLKWETSKFFETVIYDFFDCSKVFGVRQTVYPASFYFYIRGKYYFKGFLVTMTISMQENLKYNPIFSPYDDSLRKYMIPSHKPHVLMFYTVIDIRNFMSIAFTPLFIESHIGLVVPPGEAYTDFEKLFLPFENEVWIYFCVTFFLAFFVTLIVKYATRTSIQLLIFGENIKSPALNILVAFMGGGQMVLPAKSFPRFLLMAFILFSLIMR